MLHTTPASIRLLATLAALAAGCTDDGGAALPAGSPDSGAVDAASPVIDGPPAPDDAAGPPAGADARVEVPDAAAADCAPSDWAPGASATIALRHDGRDRSYAVHVGTAVTAGRPVPLVVNFHGLHNSPAIQEIFSRMNAVADREGFIVVNPQGIEASFNAGNCCGPAAEQGIDDLGFTRAIVADVAARACVDRRRVYATGFSNGGFMAHRVGCEAADLFAAVAPVAAGNAVTRCAPGRPVPVITFHGTADTVVEYATGQRAAADWATRNGCTGEPTRVAHGTAYCDRWTTCGAGVAVEMCTIPNLWHLWPSASSAHPASPAIWSFLSGYTLPD
jgi:polyhydroxybutyrate depolymerase